MERLSRETPAQVLFDCLMVDGHELLDRPLEERRARLEDFHRSHSGAIHVAVRPNV
ncbi:hypothetical protein [Sphingomonas beigongshangi]|uniref:ATP-dependent DNA ligase n=1 Tax=Sphingomonas beigongshangi TaxID=2782540 RepID=UPI003D149FED